MRVRSVSMPELGQHLDERVPGIGLYARAYLWFERQRRVRIFDNRIILGDKIVIHYVDDNLVKIEEHFYCYPTPSGFPEFILQPTRYVSAVLMPGVNKG